MKSKQLIRHLLWVFCGVILSGALISCKKKDTASAGGGASTQSVVSMKGAAR